MRIPKLVSFAAILLISYSSYAQKKSFKFMKTSHNFGTIEEDNGPAKHTFQFINIGSESIKINQVKASCGCTTPAWSKEEVAPGDTGIISASYNPKHRPGKFNKSLTITTSKNDRIILSIRGVVNPSMANIIKTYPYESEGLRFKNEYLNLNAVYKNKLFTSKLSLHNATGNDLEILKDVKLPSHIKLDFPQKLAKNKKNSNITLTYDASLINDWGKRVDEIKFKIGDKESILKITAEITEDFSNLTDEEKANAPHIKFSKTTLNFGNIKKGKEAKSKIIYTNTGKTDLVIRKISSSCGCTIVKTKKNTIVPGKSGKLMITLNTKDEDYNQSNVINIISNDPKSPFNSILIRANIIE